MVLYNIVQMLGLYSLTESQSLGVTIINHGVDNIKKKKGTIIILTGLTLLQIRVTITKLTGGFILTYVITYLFNIFLPLVVFYTTVITGFL